jgi:hypothetical protein
VTRAERWTFRIWLFAVAGSLTATFLIPIVVLLMLLVVTMPVALLLMAMPTVCLYLSGALLFYVPLRLACGHTRRRRLAIAAVSVLPVSLAGIVISTLANRETQARADAIMAGDMGEEPLLPRVKSIALLVDRGLRDEKCWDECQRLLFSGLAKTVVQGSLDALDHPSAAPVPVIRHSIVPMEEGCDNSLLYATPASETEWKGKLPAPFLWEKLGDLAQRGLCFRSDRSRDARADVYLVRNYNFTEAESRKLYDLRLHPIEAFNRRTILLWKGQRLVPLMRRTELNFELLAVPLRIEPPFSFDTYTPGRWTRGAYEQRGTSPRYNTIMGHWIRNDVRVLGLTKSPHQEFVVEGTRGPARKKP